MRVDKEMLHQTSDQWFFRSIPINGSSNQFDQWLFQNEASIAGSEAIFHSTTLFAGYGQGIITASLNILCYIVFIFIIIIIIINSIYFMYLFYIDMCILPTTIRGPTPHVSYFERYLTKPPVSDLMLNLRYYMT